jgi:hypothetical protein
LPKFLGKQIDVVDNVGHCVKQRMRCAQVGDPSVKEEHRTVGEFGKPDKEIVTT